MDLVSARESMIEVGRRIWIRGFAAANDGNLSARLDDGRFLVTAAGSIKGFLGADDLVVIDRDLRAHGGTRSASSEVRMHLAIYEERPDVFAVVHAHPPVATGFATAGVPLDLCVLPEIVATLGHVPTVPYATPSTDELASAVRPHVATGHACGLANHGVVAFDADPMAAFHHLERVEHLARILLVARLLGNVQVLSRAQVDRLMRASGATHPAGRTLEDVDEPAVSPVPDVLSADTQADAETAPRSGGRSDTVGRVADERLIALVASEVKRFLREGA